MLKQHQAIYQVKVAGRLVMSLELLSTPSFRDCDVRSHWDERETSVRATYFRSDGSQRIVLSNFAKDRIFFNDTPQFFPQIGKALLKGTTVDGRQANRWLELAPLKELYTEARRDAADATLLAARLSPP